MRRSAFWECFSFENKKVHFSVFTLHRKTSKAGTRIDSKTNTQITLAPASRLTNGLLWRQGSTVSETSQAEKSLFFIFDLFCLILEKFYH